MFKYVLTYRTILSHFVEQKKTGKFEGGTESHCKSTADAGCAC